jgi:gas vesicle protein GvpL/GvpF
VSALYLYAVVRTGSRRPSSRGLLGERLRCVACGPVAAVVGEVETMPALSARHLRAHDRVVRRLARSAPALLPARFGSLAADEAALRAGLAPRAPGLRRALEEVRGAEQMTLRISGLRAAPRPSRSGARREGSGTEYLVARHARRTAWRRLPGLNRLLAGLRPLVRGQRIEAAESSLVVSVYHLIRRGTAGQYRAAVRRARPLAPALRLACSGPWPAYAFADAFGGADDGSADFASRAGRA